MEYHNVKWERSAISNSYVTNYQKVYPIKSHLTIIFLWFSQGKQSLTIDSATWESQHRTEQHLDSLLNSIPRSEHSTLYHALVGAQFKIRSSIPHRLYGAGIFSDMTGSCLDIFRVNVGKYSIHGAYGC